MTSFIEPLLREREHLKQGPSPGEEPQGAGTVRFIAKCPGSATTVLAKAKNVLLIVNEASTGEWPDEKTWRALVPSWFGSRCPPNRTREEAEAELRAFNQLTASEQIKRIRSAEWPLLDWLEYFRPNKREWYWWDGSAIRNSFLAMAVEVNGWPFSWVSLSWLLRACGAIEVGDEEDFFGALILYEHGIEEGDQ
jgi:hypothetical protein